VYHWVAAQSSFMRVYAADAHAHVQRFVSVVEMATVIEEYTTEEQRSVVRFLFSMLFLFAYPWTVSWVFLQYV
jgi:hypothetical protein